MKRRAIGNEYFYGNKVSDYGIEQGYVDYRTFAKSFDAVMNNGIISATCEMGFWEPMNGPECNSDMDYYPEVFQWFIVDELGAEIIQMWTDDPLYYNDFLDMYVWGITHFGTSWDYVLTDIRIDEGLYNKELKKIFGEA